MDIFPCKTIDFCNLLLFQKQKQKNEAFLQIFITIQRIFFDRIYFLLNHHIFSTLLLFQKQEQRKRNVLARIYCDVTRLPDPLVPCRCPHGKVDHHCRRIKRQYRATSAVPPSLLRYGWQTPASIITIYAF